MTALCDRAGPVVPSARSTSGGKVASRSIVVAWRRCASFARTSAAHLVHHDPERVLFCAFSGTGSACTIDTSSLSYVLMVPGFITSSILWAGLGAAKPGGRGCRHGCVDRLSPSPSPRSRADRRHVSPTVP